jgi:hypothetical protein
MNFMNLLSSCILRITTAVAKVICDPDLFRQIDQKSEKAKKTGSMPRWDVDEQMHEI